MKTITHLLLILALWNATACTLSEPNPENIQKGVVKGRVTDSQGKPVANAVIIANSTDYYNKTSTGYTDANGNYRFELPGGIAEGSYDVKGTVTVKYHNKNFEMELYREDTRIFSAYDGAVRNFVFRLTGKRSATADESDLPLGATLEVHHNWDIVDARNLEITLEPVGPLVDGSTGKKIVSMLSDQSYKINDVPVGNYKITARDKASGKALGVSFLSSGKGHQSSVTGLFQDTFPGSGLYEMAISVDAL